MSIAHLFDDILKNYVQERTTNDFPGNNNIQKYFEDLKKEFEALPLVASNSRIKIKWGMGKGNWAKVPWIAFLDERETDSTQHGVYCVYLFREDMSGFYLSLIQGVTDVIEKKGRATAHVDLRKRAEALQDAFGESLTKTGFDLNKNKQIFLEASSKMGSGYEYATIAHKFYETGKIPDDAHLVADLEALLSVYQDYAIQIAGQGLHSLVGAFWESATFMDVGLRVSESLARRFAAALLSKRFLILTGLAGSGKTKLAQAFSRWLAASPDCYRLVAVGADWMGNENVLGYPNGLAKDDYVAKPALQVILHAHDYPDDPHFLILDEMNLSHVERYFADILSAIESNETLFLHHDKERKANGVTIPSELRLPQNLFIIGTVNVDETTYMFSPKVLDRANVIEFRMSEDELGSFLTQSAKTELSSLDAQGCKAGFGKRFVEAANSPVELSINARSEYSAEMLLFFKALQRYDAEFGFRTAYEAGRFAYFYELLGDSDKERTCFLKAFDCIIFQKFLPKLHGSRTKLGPLLKVLWFLCVNDVANRGENPLESAEKTARSTDRKAEPSAEIPDTAPYPMSAGKIARMWRLLRDNGFTSFAEA